MWAGWGVGPESSGLRSEWEVGREPVERRPAGLPPPLRLLQTGAAGVFSQQVPVPINVVRGTGVSPAGALSTFPPYPQQTGQGLMEITGRFQVHVSLPGSVILAMQSPA